MQFSNAHEQQLSKPRTPSKSELGCWQPERADAVVAGGARRCGDEGAHRSEIVISCFQV